MLKIFYKSDFTWSTTFFSFQATRFTTSKYKNAKCLEWSKLHHIHRKLCPTDDSLASQQLPYLRQSLECLQLTSLVKKIF